MCFKPSLREINLQLGGKIEETRTMLQAAIPALRRASSKLESLSRCLPTPLVRKIFFATNAMVPVCRASVRGVSAKNFLLWKSSKKVLQCQRLSQAKALRHRKYECRVTMRAKRNDSPSGALKHPTERELFRLLASSCEEDFEFFARAVKTVQLASLEASAYTELPRFIVASPDLFSMIRQGLMRRRGHVFHGQPA